MALDPALRILSTTIGEIGTIGLSCLMALHIAGSHVSEDDLMATVHVDSLSTLRRHLNSCAAHDYASMIKRSRAAAALWHITDIGKSIVIRVISLLGLPPAASTTGGEPRLITAPDDLTLATEKNFFSALSSSSSDLDQNSGSDQIDQIEEEEDGREFKNFLCRKYDLTGEAARRIIDDPRIWSEDLVAWMAQVYDMQRNGTKFRKSPESYAIGCLLKESGPDRPSDTALHNSRRALDLYWDQFCKERQTSMKGDEQNGT